MGEEGREETSEAATSDGAALDGTNGGRTTTKTAAQPSITSGVRLKPMPADIQNVAHALAPEVIPNGPRHRRQRDAERDEARLDTRAADWRIDTIIDAITHDDSPPTGVGWVASERVAPRVCAGRIRRDGS